MKANRNPKKFTLQYNSESTILKKNHTTGKGDFINVN